MKKKLLVLLIFGVLLLSACSEKSGIESTGETTADTSMTTASETETQAPETSGDSEFARFSRSYIDIPENTSKFIATTGEDEKVDKDVVADNHMLDSTIEIVKNGVYSYCIYTDYEEVLPKNPDVTAYEITNFSKKNNDYYKNMSSLSSSKEQRNMYSLFLDGNQYMKRDSDEHIIANKNTRDYALEKSHLAFLTELNYSISNTVTIDGKHYLREKWVPKKADVTLKYAYFFFDNHKLVAYRTVSQDGAKTFCVENISSDVDEKLFSAPKNVKWYGDDSTYVNDYRDYCLSYDDIRKKIIDTDINHFANEEVKEEIKSETHLLDDYLSIIKTRRFTVDYCHTESLNAFLTLSGLHYLRRGDDELETSSVWIEPGMGSPSYRLTMDNTIYSEDYYPYDKVAPYEYNKCDSADEKNSDFFSRLVNCTFECSNRVLLDGKEFVREKWNKETIYPIDNFYLYFRDGELVSIKNQFINSEGKEYVLLDYVFDFSSKVEDGLFTAQEDESPEL